MLRLLIFITSSIFTAVTLGTTFVPISIKVQIKEADSIVYGEVVMQDSEIVDDGMIATKYVIKLEKWLGMGKLQELPEKEIAIYTPGGTFGDRTFEVPGTATMSLGEKVVLFLGKDNKDRYWIRNLGLGKYSAKKVGNSTILVNQVFPFHPKMGQFKLSYFLDLAQRIKEEKFEVRFKDKYEIQAMKQVKVNNIKKKGRSLASIEEENDTANKANPFWLVLLLGVLGGGVAWTQARSNDK